MAAAPGLKGTLAKLWIQQRHLILYAFIGGSAVVVDVGLFTLLHEVAGWQALAANAVSVPVSVVWSFVLNATINFKTTDVILARLASFSVVSGIGFAASQAIIWAAESAGISGFVAKLVSLPLVFILQYLLNTRLTFREQKLKGVQNPSDTHTNDLEIGASK
ncbi:MAG: GtrA family protein [Acidimicrobiales bacterium]